VLEGVGERGEDAALLLCPRKIKGKKGGVEVSRASGARGEKKIKKVERGFLCCYSAKKRARLKIAAGWEGGSGVVGSWGKIVSAQRG